MIRNFKAIYLIIVVLFMASTLTWASIEDDNRLDSLARTLAENVLREISQRNSQNEYFRSIGAVGSVDFIIDMRKWHISKESPSLASSPFLTSDQEKNLNGKLNQFYDDYRHPVYVVLSPIVHGSYEFSTQGLKDVYDWLGQEMSFSDFQKLKERYGEYLKELQKYNATAPTITGALSHGAILSVESYIFYKSNTKNWMVRYGSDFTVADEIKRASFIEDEYETATKDASKFEFAGKRYTALDNHTNAIISAFRSNCLTYTKLGQLAAILKDNLAELDKPIYVKVMEPKTWALEKRKYYLDKREQERYENPLEDTQGGGLFFAADDDGYINLNDLKADGQKANMIGELPKVVELFSELEKLIINVGVLWDIWRKSGDFDSFLNGDKSKTEILLGEAKDGKLQDIAILTDIVGLRKVSVSKISYDLLSEDEMRVAINALYRVQEALKYTFGDKSLYPFAQVENLERIKLSPLERYKIEPAKNDEELLKQLKYLYENEPDKLNDEEVNLYFWLLCHLEMDCRDRPTSKNGNDRLYTEIQAFKDAIARGENVFYVGTHTDITPRPTGVQSHHGVNSVWMQAIYTDYNPNQAPSVYMLNNPNHNATRGVFNKWISEIAKQQGVTKGEVDYEKISEDEIISLAEKQFDAADVPKKVRDEYYLRWREYKKSLTRK